MSLVVLLCFASLRVRAQIMAPSARIVSPAATSRTTRLWRTHVVQEVRAALGGRTVPSTAGLARSTDVDARESETGEEIARAKAPPNSAAV